MSEAATSTVKTESAGSPPAAEPVVISGGDSPASWDELDALTATPKERKESKPKKEVKESKEASSKESEESFEKAESKTKTQENTKSDAGVEKPSAPVKLLKARDGDKQIELNADIKVPVKVDGKTVEVPLQEAINRYSQQSHLDSLYKSYKTEKDGFEKQRSMIQDALNKSYSYLVEQKDLRGFLEYFGEAMGLDAQQLYQETVGNLQQQLEEYAGMTAEERKLREIEAENAYYRKRMEAQKQATEQAKSKQQLESHVEKVMEENGMSNADIVQAWDDLIGLGYSADSLTPEYLAKYHNNHKQVVSIAAKIQELSPEHAQDEGFIEEFSTSAISLGLSEDQIEAALKEIFEKAPEKKLYDKYKKSGSRSVGQKPLKNPASDPLTFDDLI